MIGLRERTRFVVGVLFACGLLLAVLCLPRASAWYHRWQMEKCYAAAFDPALGGVMWQPTPRPRWAAWLLLESEQKSPMELYEYHRAELVRLGGLSETTYFLRHIKTSTPEGVHFVRKWMSRNCPPMHDCSSPHRPGEPMEMTVWCDAEYVDDWRRFVDEHDVSDYGTRYFESK